MNDSHQDPACAAIQPLLFLAIEGEIQGAERLEVHAHLAVCDRCRSWERGERALTALLTESRPVSNGARSRFYGIAAAALVVSLMLFLLPAAVPRGSVIERQLGPDMGWQIAGERAFEGQQTVDVPATAAVTVQLGADVQLDAIGPARFVLDTTGSQWKVKVASGTVLAAIEGAATLAAGDASALGAGNWLLSAGAAARQDPVTRQDPAPRDAAALLTEGMARFGKANPFPFGGGDAGKSREHLAAAEKLLTRAYEAADATPAQKRSALFYLACTISRQGHKEKAFALEQRYIELYPDGSEAPLVRHYMACHLLDVGRRDEARALFERVVRDKGKSSLGEAASGYLRMMAEGRGGRRAPKARKEPKKTAAPSTNKMTAERAASAVLERGDGGYLVVTVGLRPERVGDRGFLAAAAAALEFHNGDEWAWDGEDFGALERTLRRRAPENVLFVMCPERLDVVLHRRVLLLCARIDDDWFADFAFGYLTAEDGAACQRLWQRIVTVHGRGKLGGTWWQASVASVDKSFEAKTHSAEIAAAGFHGPHYYYGTGDPESDKLVERSLKTMQSAAVVEFTGCGDPQGIWLFSDQRNRKRELHWDYDP